MVLTVSRFFLEVRWSHSQLRSCFIQTCTLYTCQRVQSPEYVLNVNFKIWISLHWSLTRFFLFRILLCLLVRVGWQAIAGASTQFVGPAMSLYLCKRYILPRHHETFYSYLTGALYWNSVFEPLSTQPKIITKQKLEKNWKIKTRDRATSNFQLRKKNREIPIFSWHVVWSCIKSGKIFYIHKYCFQPRLLEQEQQSISKLSQSQMMTPASPLITPMSKVSNFIGW